MKFGRVTTQLVLGPVPLDEDDFRQLKRAKVTAVVSLQTEEDETDGGENERSLAEACGMKFVSAPVMDFDKLELIRKLPACVDEVERLIVGGDVVYLHCTAGVNRSPTVAVAYLHRKLQWPLEKALDHVQKCRRCVPDGDAIRRAGRGAAP
ncbi:MAG TPA: dual specificity protein phosphatase family protein [Terriglobales bacterium]|nr:dual specificity protein phosphatase family protein [Terriglobales bacterium]